MPTKPKPPKTPECDKLSSVKDRSQPIGEFLEWLTEIGVDLCVFHHCHNSTSEDCKSGRCEMDDQYTAVRRVALKPETKEEAVALKLMGQEKIVPFVSPNERLAAFFRIDLDLVEKERRALLEYCRKMNEVRA